MESRRVGALGAGPFSLRRAGLIGRTMEEPAIPAATLVVIRDRPGGAAPELLMVERTRKMAFAGGALVFPGGRIDDADEDLARRLPASIAHAAAAIAAIRETIEESAVVAGLTGPVDPGIGLTLQDALLGGAGFGALIERHGLTLDLAALTPFARWMPAFHQARKFDTLFFVAAAPPGDWPPRPQPGECERAFWASAEEILRQIEQGESSAIFPTKRNLERLARFADHAEAVADAARHNLATITPWIGEVDGEQHVCIPADRGYPVLSEPLSSAVRA